MRYILSFLGFLAVIVFLIVLIFRLGSSNNVTPTAPAVDMAKVASSSASFIFTEEGPIVAEEDHYQIRITVSDTNRRVEILRGYQYNVVAQADFDNNSQAFSQFVSALAQNGYNKERKTRLTSEDGVCATGRRFIFETSPADVLPRRWSTTCEEKGNIGGNINRITDLYRKQIPGYEKFISDAKRATGLKI